MKRIIVWVTIVTLILAGVFAMNACQKTDKNGVKYELNFDNFDGVTAYGEPMDLSRITITRTENGESTVITLDESMVFPIDTSKIGARVLKINYAGQTFNVPVVVMYRVQYLVDNVAINTQYVLNNSELEAVEAPEKEGYVFAGWSEEIPEIITDNITLSAEYTPYVPELTGITATYGDKLSSIQLPYTIVGSWQFDKLNNGTLSAAGEQEFDVSFIVYETGEVIKKDTLVLNVEKKEVVFSDIVDSFVYNGEEQYPTFKTDAPLNKNKDIIFYSSGNANYTDAGVYEYYFEIDHPNYKGELSGTYEIKPAEVTVTIVGEYEVVYGDAYPDIEYTIEGFDLEKLDLLDLTFTDPAEIVTGVGTYTLTATSGSPNINLIVVDGTLVVNSNSLDVGEPVPSTTTVTYGDWLDSIDFESHPKGKWEWVNPDQSVGDKGKHTYGVVFTPYDNRFEPIFSTVEITVEAKKLTIEVTNGTTFTYNGAEQMLEYVVKDADGNVYDFVVLGNDPFRDAGEYKRTLTLEDTNYDATWSKPITVKKAIPETDFSHVFTANWADAPRLSNFELPAGYAWVDDETTKLPGAGRYDTYLATFTPADTNNYETVTKPFTIVVEKAAASINDVAENYTSVYNGNVFAFENVKYSYAGAVPVFTYKNNATGAEFEGLPTYAGTYTVTIALPASDNYLAAESVTTTVTIAKADNTDVVTTTQGGEGTITYGDAATKIQLPTSVLGTWALEGNPTTVGNAGTNTFVAIFTPTDADNYNGRRVEITVTVAKKSVNEPTISATNRTQVYTGATLTSGLVDAEGYTVTDNGGVNVGSYNATISLVSGNYIWSDGTSEDKIATYSIVVATNQWTVEPTIGSWIYGEAGDTGSAQAMVGQITIEYKLADAEDGAYSTTLPTNAGAYVARFTAIDSNYATITATRNFTISKKEVSVPVISAEKLTQIYTGSALYSGLNSTDEYVVTDNGGTNVNTYTAVVSLRDKANNKWAGSDSNDISLTYAVTKAQVVVSAPSIIGWTYGNSANAPTATTNFGTVSYVYATAVDGEYTATVPTNAGTYYVKAVVATTENFVGATSEATSFTIAKAGVTINGANDTYSKVYDTKEFNITGVTVSNGAALTVVITKNGETVEKMINAGEYTVTFSYAGDNNYLAAEKAVTVTITPATNTETVIVNQSATYGNLASVIVLPEGVEGYWTLKGVNANTTVGNAGTNTFTAVFTSTTGNHNSREEIITVTVGKATVRVPIVEDKEYDEQYHNSGLSNTNDYTVTEDIGGIEHGTYRVVLTLNDPANYKWATTEEASFVIEYVISVAVNKWVDTPSIADSWEYESAGDAGHASALHGDVKIEYKLESAEDSAYSTTLPTLPGKYVARFTTTDDNYTILQVVEYFEITKRKITAPTQSETEFVYNGTTITSGIAGNDFYTVVDQGAINVQAGIVVTVTLTSEHYVWADGVETLAREYTYSIVKADIAISDPVIEGWTYGEDANEPTSTNNFGQVVSYVYATTINGEYTATIPTNAGTYYVKAIAQGNDNLNESESKPVSFTIAKAQASIEGAEESYTAIYNNSAYTISGVTASNGVALEYAYTKNGETVSQIWNAGEYTVTITLPESENHLGTSVEVTVTITKIENTDTIPTDYSATYGDKLSTLDVPASVTGTWAWSGITEATTVGNAGKQMHTLVFTPTDAENYATRTVEVEVTVYKKVVSTPVVPNTSMVYNGATQYSGLADTALYTVSNDGRVNVGTQVVTLTLVDSANYAWNDKDNASVTLDVTYSITKGTNAITDITYTESWIYGDAIADFSATATYGGVKIEYKLADADDSAYSTTRPTNAGAYVARFTATDANCAVVTATRTFTIGKVTVTTPSVAVGETTYTGSVITSGIASNDLYTVVDAGGANVDTYTAVLKLKDATNYKWSTTGESNDIELDYSIVKADIAISDPVIEGWTYDEDANEPTSTNNFGQVVSYVYATTINGEYTATVPTNAGTYYVKAIAKGNDNLNESESKPVSFTIAKAQASIEGAEKSYTATYNNSAYTISGVTASNGVALEYAYTKNGETVSQIWNAGEYTVTITLPESENHLGTSVEVTVTITKIENTDTIPTDYSATYGDKLSTLDVPASVTGTWTWSGITEATTVGNAGKQMHTLVFTPNDAENYATRTVKVEVTVYKKVVPTPAVPNASMVYNGTTQYSGLADTALYTVSNDGRVNVGTQVVTLTLVDSANYAWNDKDNASATVTVNYEITAGTNAITDITYTESWTYGDVIADFSATATYGDVNVEYKLADADDSAYSTTRPTNAGAYVARFTTTDANCAVVTVTRTFTIGKATVTTPSVAVGETTYTGSVITSGIVSTDLYDVVDAGGANVGTYTAVLKLKDATNYKWSTTQTSADIELTYKVTEVTTSISISTNGWTYGAFQAPSVSVTPAGLSSQVVIEYSTDGGANWNTTPPTEAGTDYLVRAKLTGTDNYTGASAETDFDIAKATPVLSDPWFKGGKYYKNQFTATTEGMTVTYNGNTVAGTLTIGTPVFVDGQNASYVTVKFTPTDTKNYATVETNYYFTFVSVAYINNTTAYGSIEDALAAAGTGDVVWVRPHDGPIYIMSDVTIPSGVTLLLPYGTTDDKFGKNQWSGDQPFFELHGGTCTYNTHKEGGSYRKHTDYEGHYPSELDPNKCVLEVILAAGKTITNNGILEIAGELSGGGAYAQYAGFTAGKHATLVLDANAKLISNSGSKIYAAGFIRETSKDNGSEVLIKSGATLFQPYTIKDFRDGSYMVAAKDAMGSPNWASAYNRFVMMNVSPTLKIYYGGVMSVWASLFTGSTKANNTTTQNFIGSDTAGKDATILLTKSYSYLEAKYDPTTEICDLKIYGGAKTQAMKLSVKVLTTVTVSTDNCFFPLTYHYNITLAKSDLKDEDGNLLQGADEVAIFDMGQRFKLMNGASLTIEEGVRASFGTLIVYENFVDNCAYHPAHYQYPNLPAAKLTVNGELVCGTFGGKIYSTGEGASVTINSAVSCTAYEIANIEAATLSSKVTEWNTIAEKAVLVGATHQVTGINLATTYTYENGEWVAWHVSFDSAGGSACATIGVADAYLTLPTPTRDGYEFLGWYYNGALVSSKETLKTNGDHTLTAQWKTEGEVWITIGLDSNGDGTADSTTQFNPADGDGMVYPSLPTPTKDGYRFTGWVYNGTVVTAGSAVTATGDHMLTAQWAQLYTITIGSCSNATVSGVISGDKAAAGDSIKISISYGQSSNKTVTVTNDTTGETVNSGSGTSLTFTMPASNVTITASSESSGCFVPGTLITLADGTQKKVEDLTTDDELLVFDHATGKLTVQKLLFVAHKDELATNHRVITLEFSNGNIVKIVNAHGFYNLTLNKYTYLDEENVSDYIGHEFYSASYGADGTIVEEAITLVGYSVTEEYTKVYSPATVGMLNCFAGDMLTITPFLFLTDGIGNMFEYGEDMKYDEEKMAADIEKYGLYTYEDFKDYYTYEEFMITNSAVFKVSVGKGYLTWEEILILVDYLKSEALFDQRS